MTTTYSSFAFPIPQGLAAGVILLRSAISGVLVVNQKAQGALSLLLDMGVESNSFWLRLQRSLVLTSKEAAEDEGEHKTIRSRIIHIQRPLTNPRGPKASSLAGSKAQAARAINLQFSPLVLFHRVTLLHCTLLHEALLLHRLRLLEVLAQYSHIPCVNLN